MPMAQDDIRAHYEANWRQADDAASAGEPLRYSSPVEDAVLYPAYRKLIADLSLVTDRTRVLDVGSGSGRWVDFFTRHYRPASLTGVDFAAAAVDLLRRWYPSTGHTRLAFEQCDITRPELDLGGTYDLINVANVLFHIPEPDRFMRAVQNLAAHLAPGGRIVTTEYLPRTTMRTEWMLVRSRYDFAHGVGLAGLEVVETRAFCFFANDPMGLDGPDAGTRGDFNRVRHLSAQLLAGATEPASRSYLVELLASIDRACVNYARERVAECDLPSQKLVVLARRP